MSGGLLSVVAILAAFSTGMQEALRACPFCKHFNCVEISLFTNKPWWSCCLSAARGGPVRTGHGPRTTRCARSEPRWTFRSLAPSSPRPTPHPTPPPRPSPTPLTPCPPVAAGCAPQKEVLAAAPHRNSGSSFGTFVKYGGLTIASSLRPTAPPSGI